jgi:hypothetical protein
MAPPVEQVTETKLPVRYAPPALSKDYFAPILSKKYLYEARKILGFVFAIGIHNDDRVAFAFGMNETQTNSDRPLMAEVPPQAHGFDGNNVLELRLDKVRWSGNGRPIIDKQYLGVDCLLAKGSIQTGNKLARALPIVINRKKNDEGKGGCSKILDALLYMDRVPVTSITESINWTGVK